MLLVITKLASIIQLAKPARKCKDVLANPSSTPSHVISALTDTDIYETLFLAEIAKVTDNNNKIAPKHCG